MKCREKNSERTFMKVENTEDFWTKLKETDIIVMQVNEKGIIVSDSISKLFAEFGEYLLISSNGWIEVCKEDEFNKRYEIIDIYKSNVSDKALQELLKSTKQFADEISKIKNIIPNINLNFSDKASVLDVNEILESMEKVLGKGFRKLF